MDNLRLILTPQQAASDTEIRKAVAQQLRLPFADLKDVRILRRSVDARQRNIRVLLTVQPVITPSRNADAPADGLFLPPVYQDVHHADRQVVIVGAGPAGLFAALTLLEHGIRPVLLERGKEVSERKRDIALLNRNEGLNPESNYCFGEGGAGTFSDGKLFSRSKKRGDMQRVMEIFCHHGAPAAILYETHAHIGSDRLPAIIRHMRETIIAHGGEIRFSTKATGLLFSDTPAASATASAAKRLAGVLTADGTAVTGEAVILAIGHSAHDTYRMLASSGVRLEPKGFAMGVRVEHPQALINRLMYHLGGKPQTAKADDALVSLLGNASYSLVTQADDRGVYSFCMCPGGHIVPAGSDADGCVVNGMSASHRNSPYANSGIVVEIRPEDLCANLPDHRSTTEEALHCLAFQEQVEQMAKQHGGPLCKAPAQRLRDFVEGRASTDLPPCSYLPGIVPSRLDLWLPPMIGRRLQQGFRDFDRKYRGFLTNEAVILGVESRSSSSVRIPRDKEQLYHPDLPGLYPCGEGAGYAGGITSSALDGINAALAITEKLSQLQ